MVLVVRFFDKTGGSKLYQSKHARVVIKCTTADAPLRDEHIYLIHEKHAFELNNFAVKNKLKVESVDESKITTSYKEMMNHVLLTKGFVCLRSV